MPIYEYACKACGETAEILQKVSDPPEKKCPACGKAKLEKLVSAAGFRLSGGGWYETDFKKDGKKNLVEKEAAPAAACPPAGCDAPGCGAKVASKPAKADKPAKPAKSKAKKATPA